MINKTKNILVILVAAFIAMSACNSGGSEGSEGDSYPTRPITLLVPWSAGGMTDLSSRALAAVLQKHIGTTVNVLNRTGGGGVIGHLAISRAKPDGYTVGAVTVEITMMHNMGLTPLTFKDYTPLSLLIDNAAAISVRADAPYDSVDDLIAAIRTDPGSLQASGTAKGGIWDLARINFLTAAGLEESAMPWVPSQGAAPALQELLAGGVEVVTASLSEVDALRQSGEVKTLAVMASARLKQFPDVPTLKELGIDCESSGWVSIGAPQGLDPVIQAKLENAIKAAMDDPELIEALEKAGSNIHSMQGSELLDFLQLQHDRNEKAMTLAGLKR